MPNGEMLFAPEHSLSDIGELLSSLRNAGLDESEALSMASLSLAEEVGGKLLALLKKGAPDEAATAAIGVLVGLISVGHGRCSENATAAIRVLASRGTHGDSIREAGGIPLLLRVLRDAESTAGVEHASGALAHLVMQRSANREAVCGHGGVPLLVAQLHRSSTAADYAAASLGTMAICGPPAAVEAIREGLASLPTAVLDRHRHLSRVLASSDHVRPTHPPALLPPPTVPSCHTSAAAHEGHAMMTVRERTRSFGCALLGTLVPLVKLLQRLVWTQVVWEWSGGRNAYAGMDNAAVRRCSAERRRRGCGPRSAFYFLARVLTRPHSLAASAQRFSLFACAPSSRLARACKWLSTIAQLYSFSPSLPLAVDGWSSSD